MKAAERNEARRLRRDEGLSVKEIARRLDVAKSSVSLWVRDIELTPEQHETLRGNNAMHDRQRLAREALIRKHRVRRLAAQDEGRMYAKVGDPLHAAGCMLFWAEGTKHRNIVQLSNSDPELLRLFAHFLREFFFVRDKDFRVTCHLFTDHVERQHEVEQFWLDVLDLPRTCLCKSIVNVYSKHSQKKRKNKLPYGTCKITVHSTRVAQSIYGAIQECGGFERPEWLD